MGCLKWEFGCSIFWGITCKVHHFSFDYRGTQHRKGGSIEY